jgi:S1-C subfamily serine protease
MARIKISSSNLSPANIGGVAINDAGETVGIVESVDKGEATLLPNTMVYNAAKRVLQKQASVPRPWLGIRGEPLGTFPFEQMVRGGWQPEKAKSLLQAHHGIFLTSVAPNSPAAGAALRPGDVILRVNESEVKNADEFSWSLEEIGAGTAVSFTIARPGQPVTEAVEVTLGNGPVGFTGSTEDPNVTSEVEVERIVRSFNGAANSLAGMLMSQGIETIALKPAVALRFGATSGLLVVYVNPGTVAFKSGLRTGDVIESINGRAVLAEAPKPLIDPNAAYSLNVVRNRDRIVVKIAN